MKTDRQRTQKHADLLHYLLNEDRQQVCQHLAMPVQRWTGVHLYQVHLQDVACLVGTWYWLDTLHVSQIRLRQYYSKCTMAVSLISDRVQQHSMNVSHLSFTTLI